MVRLAYLHLGSLSFFFILRLLSRLERFFPLVFANPGVTCGTTLVVMVMTVTFCGSGPVVAIAAEELHHHGDVDAPPTPPGPLETPAQNGRLPRVQMHVSQRLFGV